MLKSIAVVVGSYLLSVALVLATDPLLSRLFPGDFVRGRVPSDPALIGQLFTEPEALLVKAASLVVTLLQPHAGRFEMKRRRLRRAITRRPRTFARFS